MEGNEGSKEGRLGKEYRCIKVCHCHHLRLQTRADDSFSVEQLQEIIKDSGVTPAVNQIRFHPKVLAESEALLEFHKEHGIVTEGYSPIKPLRDGTAPGLVKVVGKIAKHKGVEPDQVLLAWSKAKG